MQRFRAHAVARVTAPRAVDGAEATENCGRDTGARVTAQVRLNARAPNDEDETQRYNPHLPASLLAGVRVDYWTLQSSRARDNLEVVVLRGRCERKARGLPRLVYPHI